MKTKTTEPPERECNVILKNVVMLLFILVIALSYKKLLKPKARNVSDKHNSLKNPYWQEADQLAISKHDRGVKQGSTKKQLHLSSQSGT